MTNPLEQQGFSIGTAAGITGLDPHTIRAWERRHAAVTPQRSAGGARRYRDEDLVRLQLLKALVENGEPIGSVAHLADDALRERLSRLMEITGDAPSSALSTRPALALLAPGVEAQLAADPASQARVDEVLGCAELDAFLKALPDTACEVVVVELERLGDAPLHALESIQKLSGDALVVVLYRFARAAELMRYARAGAQLVRAPLRSAELIRCIDHFRSLERASATRSAPAPERPPAATPDPPPRRFDDAELSRLLETSTSIECECPSHLASLVSSLLAFESYSAGCESRNEPDASLHRRLAVSSGRIRGELEGLLEQVCRHEGLLP